MKTFKDNGGRSWTISINVDAVKRTRSLLDVNLLDAVDGKLLERLVTDPVLLCDVIYCVCKPECDAKNVSDEDFGKAMAGDAIEHATTALLEELVDFFPLGKRRVLQKALGKLKTLEARALEVAEKHLDSPKLEAEMEKALSGIGDSFGELAGIVGVDPGPLTLRELTGMAEAKVREQWSHTSMLLALIANANRDPKKTRAFTPADFNPLDAGKRKRVIGKTADLSILRRVFVGNEKEKPK